MVLGVVRAGERVVMDGAERHGAVILKADIESETVDAFYTWGSDCQSGYISELINVSFCFLSGSLLA